MKRYKTKLKAHQNTNSLGAWVPISTIYGDPVMRDNSTVKEVDKLVNEMIKNEKNKIA